ncbi:7056_t:CDS:2 [Ambispora leptoticha]|uniref:7056_t:CDS:1 n=1 Tax=Ambispora leptoticha TaxID=144679 RepID=A0A9N8ZB29_9GLOM|nr:7056_t:CDS:2 [Ambispora leptoticha]
MRQTLVGVVVGTAMRKTAKVRVASQRMHPRVHKVPHDEKEDCSLGDVVRIEACRPLSALKRFVVSEIIKPARTWQDPETGEVKR